MVVEKDGIVWSVQPGLESSLFDGWTCSLSALSSDERCHIIKSNPQRTVALMDLSAGPLQRRVIIKFYKIFGARQIIKHLLLPSKAETERRVAAELKKLDIPTVAPLAVGSRHRHGLLKESYLILEEIPNTLSLHEYTLSGESLDLSRRCREISAVARFVRKLHDAGVFHYDFHAGNFLTSPEGPTDKLIIVDLHDVHIGKRLTAAERVRNLVKFNRFYSRATSRTDRMRFLREYTTADTLSQEDTKQMARDIEVATLRSNRALWRRRDKRCMGSNKYFMHFRSNGWRGYVRRDAASPEMLALLGSPSTDSAHSEDILKSSRTTTLVRVLLDKQGSDGPESVLLKRFNRRNAMDALKGLFGCSKAARTWRAAHALMVRGIPTATSLALLEKARFFLTADSYFVTSEIAQARPIDRFVAEEYKEADGQLLREKHRMIESLARLIRWLHTCQLSHRDLKASNILVRRSDNKLELFLVDLDGLRLRSSVSDEERMNNLVRTNLSFHGADTVTRSDRLRFLRIYLSPGLRRERLRHFWREIGLRTERIASQSGKGYVWNNV